ncbi:MAG: hypothetical protein QM784_21860 [Polyangiaceae bacterium]
MQNIYGNSRRASFVVVMSLVLFGCGKKDFHSDGTGGASGAGGAGGESESSRGGHGGATTGTTSVGGASGGTSATSSTAPTMTAITATLADATVRVLSAQSTSIAITLGRVGASEGDIEVVALGLPAGVGTAKVTATGNAGTAQITIQAGPTAQIGGPYSFQLVASSVAESIRHGVGRGGALRRATTR